MTNGTISQRSPFTVKNRIASRPSFLTGGIITDGKWKMEDGKGSGLSAGAASATLFHFPSSLFPFPSARSVVDRDQHDEDRKSGGRAGSDPGNDRLGDHVPAVAGLGCETD